MAERAQSVIDANYFEEAAREVLEEQTGLLSEAGGAVREAHLVMGPPIEAILNLNEELGSNLIVMGSRGHGPIGRLVFGSVSKGVVHRATRSVLVMRGGDSSWPPERVVIRDDGSPAAKKAGKLTSSIGELFEARVVLVRAYPELVEADPVGRALNPRGVGDALHQAEQNLRECAGEAPRDRDQGRESSCGDA